MGLCKFGFVTIYMSEPLTRALTFGASIHVFSSQIKHVFGIKVARFSGPLKLVYVSWHHCFLGSSLAIHYAVKLQQYSVCLLIFLSQSTAEGFLVSEVIL